MESEFMNKRLGKGLIVSCQALPHEPLHSPYIMSRMAVAAIEGGAIAIRANGYNDIIEIKKYVNVPIIGLVKRDYADSPIYITPTRIEIDELASAGVDVIALDATDRERPNNEALKDLIHYAREHYPNIELMADIATYEEGITADQLGFDYISTTMSGYTEETKDVIKPNLDLIKQLNGKINAILIAEGGISTPEQLQTAFRNGAYSVVVGGAITRPQQITKAFNQAFLELGC
jgi:N-acylglucosamine-6-phosphate 2-epimerase